MPTLLLMRHAEADAQFRGPDLDVPLSAAGEEHAAAVNRWLAERDILPEVTLVSPALRCRRTAELVAPTATAVIDQPLHLADADVLLQQIRELSLLGHAPQILLVVAHNPGIPTLVGELHPGEPPPGWDRRKGWPPGTLAVLETEQPWAEFTHAALTAVCGA